MNSPTIYYSSITKRNGSWQDSDGYYLSDDKTALEKKIAALPIHEEHVSWEYGVIESFETNQEKYESFCQSANKGLLWVDNYEIDKFK